MKNFESDSLGYLIKFARKQKGQPFCSEAVTLAAERAGIVSGDLRHWGRTFQIAAREGYIRRSAVAFRRARGNGTLTLGWVAS